jgi:hypothetical protein
VQAKNMVEVEKDCRICQLFRRCLYCVGVWCFFKRSIVCTEGVLCVQKMFIVFRRFIVFRGRTKLCVQKVYISLIKESQ